MNSLLQAILTAATPLLPILVPGIALLARSQKHSILKQGVTVIATSLASNILLLTIAALLGMPSTYITLILITITIALSLYWQVHHRTIAFLWKLLTITTPILIIYLFLAIPFLINQDGLPTGDVQKSIYWAQQINQTHHLPDYQTATAQLNRDPVDFYTPGLHALTANIMQLSGNSLTSIGLLALVLGATMVYLIAAFAPLLIKKSPTIYLLAPLFLLSNLRFLRYLREPGYHFQNLAGELLLFLVLYFGLQFLNKTKYPRTNLALIVALGLSLAITHQFSTFIAAFLAIPVTIALSIHFYQQIISHLKQPLFTAPTAIATLIIATLAVNLKLYQKIPHIFTTTPHLLPLTPALSSYPTLMGVIWIFTALTGLLTIAITAYKKHQPIPLTFATISVVILALSQGPRLGIDIPPVRALFYFALPGSLLAAYTFVKIWQHLQANHPLTKLTLRALLLVTALIAIITSTQTAYTSSNPNIRTNSTLTAPETTLIDYLAATDKTQAVLVDDYNQRSGSWLLLSGKPTFSRVAADLERIMDESRQSQKRYQLYLKHLDYEKIYSLSSRPEILNLLTKQNISHVTGVTNITANGFLQNPSLTPGPIGDKIQLFTAKSTYQPPTCTPGTLCHWLLHSSTMTNAIGDSSDTFAHLPASLRTTRLSAPQTTSNTLYRTTTAPYIPLQFNVGDYTAALIDQDNDTYPDTNLSLLVELTNTPATPLAIITPSGQQYPLQPNQKLPISTQDLKITDEGFITIIIQNPQQQPLNISLIALGLADVP